MPNICECEKIVGSVEHLILEREINEIKVLNNINMYVEYINT